jgi:hypothetical protein
VSEPAGFSNSGVLKATDDVRYDVVRRLGCGTAAKQAKRNNPRSHPVLPREVPAMVVAFDRVGKALSFVAR